MAKVKLVVAFDTEFTGPFGHPFRSQIIDEAGITRKVTKKPYMIAIGGAAVTVEKNPKVISMWYKAIEPPDIKYGFEPRTVKEFWNRPDVNPLLEKFTREAVHAVDAMSSFVEWLENLNEKYDMVVCCDSSTDASWVEKYLTKFSSTPPLSVFHGKYTGWPFITDDYYRGVLHTDALFGLDDQIKNWLGEFNPPSYDWPKDTAMQHHPTFDAWEIACLFASVIARDQKIA